MKFDHPLTREQQHLVEQNISLIHWTIWKYIDVKEEICGLAYDDLYHHRQGAGPGEPGCDPGNRGKDILFMFPRITKAKSTTRLVLKRPQD